MSKEKKRKKDDTEETVTCTYCIVYELGGGTTRGSFTIEQVWNEADQKKSSSGRFAILRAAVADHCGVTVDTVGIMNIINLDDVLFVSS